MKESTYYFSHDYHSRSDPKLIRILQTMDFYGIGLYWCIVEMLYEEGGYLCFSELSTYAFSLHTTEAKMTELISIPEVFSFDDERFWSESVLSRLEKRASRSRSAKYSADQRWKRNEEQTPDANAQRTQLKRNAVNENKINKNKVKNNKINKTNDKKQFISPTREEVISYFNSKTYSKDSANKFFDYYNETNWVDSRGNKVKNWKQKAIAIWFKPENEMNNEKSGTKQPDPTGQIRKKVSDENYTDKFRP